MVTESSLLGVGNPLTEVVPPGGHSAPCLRAHWTETRVAVSTLHCTGQLYHHHPHTQSKE